MSISRKMRIAVCAAIIFAGALPDFAQEAQNAPTNAKPATAKAELSAANLLHKTKVLPSLAKAAEDALNSGLPSLAESMAIRVYEDSAADPSTKDSARQTIINACISQGKFETAEKYLSLIAKKTPADKVREALIFVGQGKYEEAENIVSSLEENPEDKAFTSWLHMAKGYIAYAKGDFSKAIEEFEQAKKNSRNGYLFADAEIAINTCKISKEDGKEDLAKLEDELAKKVSLYLGTTTGFQFAKQYAGVLFKNGKLEKALDVINTQLEIEIADSVDKDELRLIGAAITPDVDKRISALKTIMSTSNSTGVIDYALALYVRDTKDGANAQMEFLNELAKKGSPAIRDRILLEIAKNCLKLHDNKNAEIAAKRILDEYPASAYKNYALRILAWTAFNGENEKTPQYRLAASYLEELANIEKNPEKAAKIKILAADCYFLNQDYAGAGKIYNQLIDSDSKNRAKLVEHAIDALLLQNRDNDAVKLLSRLQSENKIDENTLWSCAWKILSQYRRNSGDSKTLESIEKVLENHKDISPSLRTKMLWLRARITDENGNPARVIKLCKQLELELAKLENKSAPDIKTIRANAMLMLARAYEAVGKLEGKDGAFATYEILRKNFPDSEAAQISYLYEAADLASLERLNAARELCVKLVEKYPRGKYEYSALFDAAEYSRRMGLDSNYRTALTLLEKLAKDYPENPRNFYAKLSQAEILRLMGAFADARALYNDLINTSPQHPEIYLAWMGLGDSTSALPGRAKDAAAIFERIYALPSISDSARAESAYKWAFALSSADKRSEADEVRWVTSLELLKDKNISAAARYWIGRSLFDMARSLELRGQARDARSAYEIIVKYNLPSSKIAKIKLGEKEKE